MNIEDLGHNILSALDEGLIQALYRLASVEPEAVLAELSGPDRPVRNIEAVASLPVEVLDPIASRYIRQARRSAAVSGASLGFGGWVGVPPGLLHLVVLIVRLAQRLAVTYGVDFRTGRGEIELWKALASGVGANVDWEGTEAELIRRLPAVVTGTGTFANPLLVKAAQAVLMRVAVTAGTRVTRFLPVVGAGSGAVLNYLEMHRVGRRLKETWRTRHAIAGFDPSDAVVVEILQG